MRDNDGSLEQMSKHGDASYLLGLEPKRTDRRQTTEPGFDCPTLDQLTVDAESAANFFAPFHGGRLPPLASLFSREKKQSCQNKISNRAGSHSTSEEILSFSGPDLTQPQEQESIIASDCHSYGHLPKPVHAYSEYIQQTMNLTNTVYQNINVGNMVSISSVAARSLSRKRQNSCFREGALPPNVNAAFKKLRNLIPTEPADRRLSKVETLRLAVSYIQHLGQTLSSDHWVEQPCLMDQILIGDKEKTNAPVCTFCMSKKRKLCVNSR